jgi:hypothetical protein
MLLLGAAGAKAADYSPWIDRQSGIDALIQLAQRQDTCCKHCTNGQPCRNTCISAKATCKSPPGVRVRSRSYHDPRPAGQVSEKGN